MNNRRSIAIAGLLVLASLLVPIAVVLSGFPFAHRYFNLSITLLACGLLSIAFCAVDSARLTWRPVGAAAGIFVLACLFEVAPFRPLFAAFRPFWLEYGDADRAELGRLNASWMGWGEEIMTAGKMLEAACLAGHPAFAGTACTDVKMYNMHWGLWLPGPSIIHVEPYETVKGAPPLDRKSFYLVNRLFLIADKFPIPNIAPDFVVSYRSYALAWVYRGDRLRNAGYQFR